MAINIENYNPLDEVSTKVELIKLLTKNPFTPTSYVISDTPTVSAGVDILSAKLNSSINSGTNIQNKGTNCIAIGENIVIPEGCENITAIGNNLSFASGVSNVSVINSSDLEIVDSNVNYVGGVIQSEFVSDNLFENKTANFSLNPNTMSIVNVTCSSANITVYLPSPSTCIANNISKIFNVKKVDDTIYHVVIDAGEDRIDGKITIELTRFGDGVTLYTDGSNWFIK